MYYPAPPSIIPERPPPVNILHYTGWIPEGGAGGHNLTSIAMYNYKLPQASSIYKQNKSRARSRSEQKQGGCGCGCLENSASGRQGQSQFLAVWSVYTYSSLHVALWHLINRICNAHELESAATVLFSLNRGAGFTSLNYWCLCEAAE
jgi:hypothetical protein